MTLCPQALSLRLECVHLVLQLREDRAMVVESAQTPHLCLQTAGVLLSQGRKKGRGTGYGPNAVVQPGPRGTRDTAVSDTAAVLATEIYSNHTPLTRTTPTIFPLYISFHSRRHMPQS